MAYRVLWVRHSVKRTKGEGKFVDDEIVRVVLDFHDPAKPLLVLGAKGRIIRTAKRFIIDRDRLLDVVQNLSIHTIPDKQIYSLFECEN